MTIAELEQAVTQLSERELARFRAWFEDFDAKAWDEQIERDAKSGKLDKIAEKALHEYRTGKAQEQPAYPMSTTQATAEVFWSAFNVLPVEEKRAVIQHIVQDDNLRQDLMDLSVIEERRDEPEHPLRARKPKFGSAKGKIKFAKGFDEPLADFREYMP